MENIFINTAALLQSLHFNIVNEDCHRPWGGFFVIDDSQAEKFAKHFTKANDKESVFTFTLKSGVIEFNNNKGIILAE